MDWRCAVNTANLKLQVNGYVALRRALGFGMRAEERLLRDFVQFVENHGVDDPIRAQLVVDWACDAKVQRSAGREASRLSVVRGFLYHLRAIAPETEVPGRGLIACVRRTKPYLFSDEEITKLMDAASSLGPKKSLRPHTFRTLIGLLASTGLRVGEAIRLKQAETHLNANPPHVEIIQTNFRKSRIVPLHSTTADAMCKYAEQRNCLHYDGLSESFFVSEQGQQLHYSALRRTFRTLTDRLRIIAVDGGRAPGVHALRHAFAIRRMLTWYQAGMNVQSLLPNLSIYLGHVQPKDSYWYLTSTPELLSAAADSFQHYAEQGEPS